MLARAISRLTGKTTRSRYGSTMPIETSNKGFTVRGMGTSTSQWSRPGLSNRIEMLIRLSIYVLPSLSLKGIIAIERNVAVKFGESKEIQRAIMRAKSEKKSLSSIVSQIDKSATNYHDESVRLFTHLCEIVLESAQGGAFVRGRLNAVGSQLGLSSEMSDSLMKRKGI